MPLSINPHASSVLLYEYPALVQSSVLLYYKFTRCPHVILDQFVCIAQEDYWRILNHVEKNTHKVEEEGEIVMVKEHRELDRSGTRKGHIVIKVSDFQVSCFLMLRNWSSITVFKKAFLLFMKCEGAKICKMDLETQRKVEIGL